MKTKYKSRAKKQKIEHGEKIKNRNQVFNSMIGFLPHYVVEQNTGTTKRTAKYNMREVVLLQADISGFTAMSEKLAAMGKQGSEEVNRIINNFFGPLISIVHKWQGDIYRFGGDAFVAFFPERKNIDDISLRAVQAASEILKYVKKHSSTQTHGGVFKIKIHIGLKKGKVYFQDLKTDFFMGGRTANELISVLDWAAAGEIIVDALVKEDLKGYRFTKKGKTWKYNPGKTVPGKKPLPGEAIKKKIISNQEFNSIRKYIPDWLFRRIELKPYFDHKDGEHRKIAVVFLHFGGIPYDSKPARAAAVLDKFHDIVRETLAKYGGWLNAIDIYKDSERILAVFGFPTAFEDEERRAALFTYEVMNHPDLKKIPMRAGINAGSIFAAPVGSEVRREYATLGDAVNLSARLGAKAPTNSIVVSEPIFYKTVALFDYEALGEQEYKGKKRKTRAYKITQRKKIEQKAMARWLSESGKLIGRAKEVGKISRLIEQVKNSKGQILTISGEPGIGKSRLVQEFISQARKGDFRILKGDCISYGSAFSYHPWVNIMNEFYGLLPEDTIKTRAEKIRKKTAAIDKKLSGWLPVIGEVMGVPFPETTLTKFLDAKIKKQRVFDIILDFMKYLARNKPLAIIIEDVHWSDTASLELINYIGRNIGLHPILLNLVYRPLKKKEEFLEKDYTTQIVLRELSREDSLTLFQSLLDIKDVPKSFSNLVVEKSQGNPFYLEELIKSLIEQGYIAEEKGSWKCASDVKGLQLPDSVEAVILSRIDRLDLAERDVLQVASVLGREFEGYLLSGIYPNERILESALKTLQRLDLIKLEKSDRRPKYFFKHVMTREVAYDTLSFARRRELHCQSGNYIEQELKDRKEEFLGLLSYHFFEGGDYDKSLSYSVEAGEKAKKVYANEEAIEFFTRAINSYELLEKQK